MDRAAPYRWGRRCVGRPCTALGWIVLLSALLCTGGIVSSSSPYVLVQQSMTWVNALTFCRAQYTDLASVQSDTELTLVAFAAGLNEVWIGLYLCAPGLWRWSDGDVLGTYTKWNSGMPGQTSYSCARQIYARWNDGSCSSRYYFVCYKASAPTAAPTLPSTCQWPLLSSTVASPTDPGTNNVSGTSRQNSGSNQQNVNGQTIGPTVQRVTWSTGQWQSSWTAGPSQSQVATSPSPSSLVSPGPAGSTSQSQMSAVQSVADPSGTLHLVRTPMSWLKSRQYCRSNFTDLAVVLSPQDQNNMAALLSPYIPSAGFWIGMRYNRFQSRWYWSGGQRWGTFSYWGAGEPSDSFSKPCGKISGAPMQNLTWSSECCGQELPFVCL